MNFAAPSAPDPARPLHRTRGNCPHHSAGLGHSPLVYTAFDGSDFWLAEAMVAHVSRHGGLPINPETCLGYKSAVDHLVWKQEVLRADASLVEKCDELWVYSDQTAHQWLDGQLAEGALVELLWYLRITEQYGRRPRVFRVSRAELAAGRDPQPTVILDLTFAKAAQALGVHRSEVVQLIDALATSGTWPVALFAFDLHDSKYGEWMRGWAIRHNFAPIVPTIALNPQSVGGLANTKAMWKRLSGTVDVLVMPRTPGEVPSPWVAELELIARSNRLEVQSPTWFDLGTPKALHGPAWPITAAEAADLQGTTTHSIPGGVG